jgi:hypothetical protein
MRGAGGAETFEQFDVERRAQGDVQLVGAGVDVLADAIEQLLVRAGEDPGTDEVCDRSELVPQVVLVRGDAEVDGAADLGRIAAHRLAVVVKDRTLVGEHIGSDERDVPPVGVLRGDLQGALLAAAADPDRQLGLHGPWLVAGVGQREVVAGEVGDVVVQQAAQALDAFLELIEALLGAGELDAVCVVLDLGPAGADAHLGATAGQQVDAGDGLRQYRGVPVADRVDRASHNGPSTSNRRARRAC